VSKYLRQERLPTSLSEKLLEDIAEPAVESRDGDVEPYLAALRRCKTKLSTPDEELLELQYAEDLGSRQIADRLQRTQQSVCQSLKRIRRWLLECVQMELSRQDRSGEDLS
jgi:RNA polymerase sigma-70 factor, ECF subfamily